MSSERVSEIFHLLEIPLELYVPFKTRSISAIAFSGFFKMAVAQDSSEEIRT